VAALYSAYVALLFVLRGETPFAAHGVTLSQVLATYVASGLVGGILYAVLHPLRNKLLGRVILGVVVASLVFFGIGVATEGLPTGWQRATWEQTVILGSLLGVPIGLLWRRATGS
jgi:hypothetical protein